MMASNVHNKSLFMHSSFTISLLLCYSGLIFSQVLRACSLTRLFALASNWKSPVGCLSKPDPQAKAQPLQPLCLRHHCAITQGFSLHAQRTKPTHFTQWRVKLNNGSGFTDEWYATLSHRRAHKVEWHYCWCVDSERKCMTGLLRRQEYYVNIWYCTVVKIHDSMILNMTRSLWRKREKL